MNSEDIEIEDKDDESCVKSIWAGKARWEKLKLVKDELGTWNDLIDITIEQLLSSGLISKEARKAISKINHDAGLDHLNDANWRSSFGANEPWEETPTHLRKIGEVMEEINGEMQKLTQAVEDHAMAMLEAELVRPEFE